MSVLWAWVITLQFWQVMCLMLLTVASFWGLAVGVVYLVKSIVKAIVSLVKDSDIESIGMDGIKFDQDDEVKK